jgi:hypothetical protein
MKSDIVFKPALLASVFAIASSACGCVSTPEDAVLAAIPQALAGGAATDVWRPFEPDSPWNAPVAAAASIDAQSAALIDDLAASSPYGPQLGVNLRSFSIPLYWADETTPKTRVHCNVGGTGFESRDGMDATAMIPIPDGAAPDSFSDGHLLVVDRSAQREWGLFRAAPGGGGWTCSLGADMDLTGDGVRPIAETNDTWYTSHGPRACGFPLVAGLIRPEEVRAGHIDHALVIAYPHIRAGIYTPPASTAQTRAAEAIKSRGIPCGGRVQLDPELDVESLPISDGAKVIARALQEYGAFVGDYSGSISLYADNSPDALAQWDELPIADVDQLELNRFRLLQLGTLYDNGNGD